MAPGMAHCSGGEGPDNFDKISVMEQSLQPVAIGAAAEATKRLKPPV